MSLTSAITSAILPSSGPVGNDAGSREGLIHGRHCLQPMLGRRWQRSVPSRRPGPMPATERDGGRRQVCDCELTGRAVRKEAGEPFLRVHEGRAHRQRAPGSRRRLGDGVCREAKPRRRRKRLAAHYEHNALRRWRLPKGQAPLDIPWGTVPSPHACRPFGSRALNEP